jgi:hypothetical protein
MAECVAVPDYDGVIVAPETDAPVIVAEPSVITVNLSGSGSFYYRHDQAAAAATWTINHNLGTRPNVMAYTTGGQEIWGEVLHISANQIQIFFDTAIAGFAICS